MISTSLQSLLAQILGNVPLRELRNKALMHSGELTWVAFGQGVALIGGFGMIKILTSRLGPEVYGQFALYLTISGILNAFIYGPLANIASRFVATYREKGRIRAFYHAFGILTAVSSLAIGCFGCLYYAFSLSDPQMNSGAAVAAVGYGVATGFSATLFAIINAMRQRKAAAVFQAVDIICRGGCAVGAVYLLTRTTTAAIGGYFAGAVVVASLQTYYLARTYCNEAEPQAPTDAVKGDIMSFIHFAKPFVGWAAIGSVSTYGDRWVLGLFASTRDVGIYFALAQIANAPVNLLASVFSQLMTPILFSNAGDAKDALRLHLANRRLAMSSLALGLVLTFVCLAIGLCQRPLALLLTTAAFAEKSSLLLPVAFATSLVQLSRFIATKGIYLGRHAKYIVPTFWHMMIFLAFAVVLAPRLGSMGIAFASLIAGMTYLGLILWLNSRFDHPVGAT